MKTMMRSISSKIIDWEDAAEVRKKLQNCSLVFTNGCFDILHRGHAEYLEMARNLGDCLWVGLNSDESVRRLKGESRPVNPQEDRAFLLASLEAVDFVTVFSETTPLRLIEILRPSIHTKGGDYSPDLLPETSLVESLGGKVLILPFVSGRSTSQIIKKLEKQS